MHEYKKYPNRRLYDLTTSKYVTVADIRKDIVDGESIRVLDSRDDADITRSVLLQILSEQEAEGHNSILTNRVIEHVIRFYGDAFGGIASSYIEQSILSFLEYQDQYRTQVRKMQEANPFNAMREAFERGAELWPGTRPENPDKEG